MISEESLKDGKWEQRPDEMVVETTRVKKKRLAMKKIKL